MTPQQLRNSILQLAIEGKLVEQKSAEGTGEELYQLIQEQKSELIKTGKLKRQKILPEITEDEIPFEIPRTWKWVRLNQIVYNRGQKKPTSKFWYIDIGAIDNSNQKIKDSKNIIDADSAPSRARRIVEIGDVLYSTVRPYLHNMCIIDDSAGQIETIASTGLAAMTCYEKVFNKYLFYYLMSPSFDQYANSLENSKGVAYPAINDRRLYKAVVPLPPFDEQKRIVEKIEAIFSILDRYETAWQKLDDLNRQFPEKLQKSILQEVIQGKLSTQRLEDGTSEMLFSEIQAKKKILVEKKILKQQKELPEITEKEIPFKIPDTWKWVRLWSIVNFFIGKTPPREEPEWWGNDTPWVSISDMSDYGYIKETKEMVSKKAIEQKFSSISKVGTLLMSFKLTVGRTSILDCNAVHNEAIISVVPYVDHDNSLRDYLFYVLPFLTQWGDSRNAIKGKTLNSKSISSLLIPVPPIEEQKRIVKKIKKILTLINVKYKL